MTVLLAAAKHVAKMRNALTESHNTVSVKLCYRSWFSSEAGRRSGVSKIQSISFVCVRHAADQKKNPFFFTALCAKHFIHIKDVLDQLEKHGPKFNAVGTSRGRTMQFDKVSFLFQFEFSFPPQPSTPVPCYYSGLT